MHGRRVFGIQNAEQAKAIRLKGEGVKLGESKNRFLSDRLQKYTPKPWIAMPWESSEMENDEWLHVNYYPEGEKNE